MQIMSKYVWEKVEMRGSEGLLQKCKGKQDYHFVTPMSNSIHRFITPVKPEYF